MVGRHHVEASFGFLGTSAIARSVHLYRLPGSERILLENEGTAVRSAYEDPDSTQECSGNRDRPLHPITRYLQAQYTNCGEQSNVREDEAIPRHVEAHLMGSSGDGEESEEEEEDAHPDNSNGETGTYTLEAGDMYFTPSAYPHQIEVLPEGGEEIHLCIFFDQPMPFDIGYKASATGMPHEAMAATMGIERSEMPKLEDAFGAPLIVPKINAVDEVEEWTK